VAPPTEFHVSIIVLFAPLADKLSAAERGVAALTSLEREPVVLSVSTAATL